jgi:hypothetical protein
MLRPLGAEKVISEALMKHKLTASALGYADLLLSNFLTESTTETNLCPS